MIWSWILWIQNFFKCLLCLIFVIDDSQFWQRVSLLSKWQLLWISNSYKIIDMKDVSGVLFRKNIKLVEEMKLLQNSEKFISFIIQSSHWLIADKISDIDYDFILNYKVFHIISVICLLNHIILSFCEIVISNWEYSIHDSSNLSGRINLKLLLYCDSLCNIRIKRHTRAETFVKIKWYHFDKSVDSIIISKFNYW